MSEQTKKAFILSVKRLRFFFNNIKDYTQEHGPVLEARANVQSCSDEDLSSVTKWMEEATQAIQESKRFIDLIQS